MNNNSWWDQATDDQRRQFTRQCINIAASLHARVGSGIAGMKTVQSGVNALRRNLKGPDAAIAAECVRSLTEFTSIENPPIDFADMLGMVGGRTDA